MPSRFEQLCSSLNINIDAMSENNLTAIKDWYQEHVSSTLPSQDIVVETRHYLDVFLMNVKANKLECFVALNDMNPIQYAATKGYDKFISELEPAERERCNIAVERTGMTPLHLAANYGHVQTVKALLKQEAEPAKKNKMEQYPIFSALFTPISANSTYRRKKIEIFKILKNAAPQLIEAQDISGTTVTNLAVVHGYDSIVKDLVESHRTSLMTPDNFNKYPIHYAILNHQLKIIQILMGLPEMATIPDAKARTVLHYAVQQNNSDILRACISVDNIEMRDFNNLTPILSAAKFGNLEAVQELVGQGSDVLATDSSGNGILHHAVMSKSIELVNWLLINLTLGINSSNNMGETALECASKESLGDICALLAQYSGGNSLN